jgi:hypothetical protein
MSSNHVLLETIQLTQNASSVVFDNIPTTGYTDLKLVASARSTRAMQEDGFGIRLNASTSGYTYKILGGNGASLYNLNSTYEQTWVCNLPAASSTSGMFGNAEAYIPNYRSDVAKTYSVDGNSENNGTTAYLTIGSIQQSSTAAITSITCFAQNGNLLSGSTFSLYGVAALNATPTVAPKATGGNLVATDGTFWYHAFTSSGNFIPQISLNAKIMVVGGGAGGGAHIAGGGGAGAINDFTSTYALTGNTSYVCTIGAGGGGNTGTAKGSPGISSVFSGLDTTITANGGGYGGGNDVFPGGPGGSGGGAAASGGGAAGGTASGPNTFAGGSGWYGPYPTYSAGGGGGATAAGGNGSTSASVGGNGGQGMLLSSIDSNLTTVLAGALSGMTRVSSGGGGCGQNPAGGAQTGGTGGTGGGNGGFGSTNATNATSYGSGGGGGNWSDAGGGATGDGGNGYQGIVIIRYPVAS